MASSRQEAQRLISENKILVNKSVADKPSRMVSMTDLIFVEPEFKWVSRGAHKLEFALTALEVDVSGLNVLDAGASTGGFTQVLLLRDAKKVVAVDVGKNQIDPRVLNDLRVSNFEKINLKNIDESDRNTFLEPDENFGLIVGDLSFISLTLIIPKLVKVFVSEGTQMLLLVKPQFEVSPKN